MKKQSTTTIFRVSGVLAIATMFFVQIVMPAPSASAAQITTRSLTLVAGDNNTTGANGGSLPGKNVRHRFTFTLPTAASVGSVQFQYCTTAADVGGASCVSPTGLTAAAAVIDGATTGLTGLTMVHGPSNVFHLTRSPGATQAIPANTLITIQVNGVVNPTDVNKTFFVRIGTFASFDATGVPIDAGTVAASTTNQIDLSGVMPESLVFCTGADILLTAGVPDCSTATSGTITFNQLLSPTDTAYSSSKMAASTNAGAGYSITVNGPTLTSGSNTILAMNALDTSKHGVSQFGMNLVSNTPTTSIPVFGGTITPATNGTSYKAQPTANYGVVDSFKFTDGDTIADSASAGTDAQIYTVSYIANVPGSQPAGTYATTLTYICTPTY